MKRRRVGGERNRRRGNRRERATVRRPSGTFDASPPPRSRSSVPSRSTDEHDERAEEERARESPGISSQMPRAQDANGAECARFARARSPRVAEDRTWNSPVSRGKRYRPAKSALSKVSFRERNRLGNPSLDCGLGATRVPIAEIN